MPRKHIFKITRLPTKLPPHILPQTLASGEKLGQETGNAACAKAASRSKETLPQETKRAKGTRKSKVRGHKEISTHLVVSRFGSPHPFRLRSAKTVCKHHVWKDVIGGMQTNDHSHVHDNTPIRAQASNIFRERQAIVSEHPSAPSRVCSAFRGG